VDVGVLVAFGMILEPEILAIPRRGFLNVHFSLLPRWRGPAPVPRAIGAGDRTTGVTIIEMDEGVDTGPILVSRSVEIGERETAGELAGRLSELGAELLRQVLVPYGEAAFEPVPQSEAGVTYAPRIEPSEARIALSDPAPRIERHVRAFNPRPGAYALVGSERLKIWRVEVAGEDGLEAGELRVRDRRLLLGTGEGALELVEVQPAGKPRMPGAAWARGRRGALGYLS
jgi:methionyl-tRNA formyltransferase